MANKLKSLSDNDMEVLRALEAYRLDEFNLSENRVWCRPLDIGGTSGSWHSDVLRKLVKRDLVVRMPRSVPDGARGSYRYTTSKKGQAVLLEAGYYEQRRRAQEHLAKVGEKLW